MTKAEIIKVLEIIKEEYEEMPVFAPRLPALERAIKALEQPEIIRCVDCYYWTSKCEDNWHYCAYLDSYHKADFYCAVGRRREE